MAWQARIGYGGEDHSLGAFDTKEQAAHAYDQAARMHRREALLNFTSAEAGAEAAAQAEAEGLGMLRSAVAQEASKAQYRVAQMPPMPMTDQEMQWQRAWSSIVLRHARSEWDQRVRAWTRLGQENLPSPRTSFALGALWRAEASDVMRAAEAREASLAAGGGRRRGAARLLASEDVDGHEVALGVAVLAGLGGGHFHDFKGTTLEKKFFSPFNQLVLNLYARIYPR